MGAGLDGLVSLAASWGTLGVGATGGVWARPGVRGVTGVPAGGAEPSQPGVLVISRGDQQREPPLIRLISTSQLFPLMRQSRG